MVTTSDATKTTAQELAPSEAPAFYLAVVMEDVLVNGHEVAFETVRELLPNAAKKKAWTAPMFMRCKGDAVAADFIERVAEALELEPVEMEQLKTQFAEIFPQRVLAKAAEKLPAGLVTWFEKARSRNGALIALSLLPDDAANALFAKMQLEQVGFVRAALPNDASMPLAKRLVRLARKLKVLSAKMVMIAVGTATARAALEAGFQCVAVPNDLTAYADFSGCQYILEQYSDVSADELLDTLFPKIVTSSKR